MENENTKLEQNLNKVSSDSTNKTRGRMILKGLSDHQKMRVRNGSISLAGAAAGIGLFSLLKPLVSKGETIPSGPIDDDPSGEEAVVVYTDACFAHTVDDNMEFGEAFSTARGEIGPGGFFEYRGNIYHTYYKEEWDKLGEGGQEEFWVSVTKSADFENVELVDDRSLIADSRGINIDDDQEAEIIIEDVNGDGVVDVKEVDLNNDGNMDVIYDPNLVTKRAEESVAEKIKSTDGNLDPEPPKKIDTAPEVQILNSQPSDQAEIPEAIPTDEGEDTEIVDMSELTNMDTEIDVDMIVVDAGEDGFAEDDISKEDSEDDFELLEPEDSITEIDSEISDDIDVVDDNLLDI